MCRYEETGTKGQVEAGPGSRRPEERFTKWLVRYLRQLAATFCSPTMIILLVAGQLLCLLELSTKVRKDSQQCMEKVPNRVFSLMKANK